MLVVAADQAPPPPPPGGTTLLARLDWRSSRLAEACALADLVFADTTGIVDGDLPGALDRLAAALPGKLPRLVLCCARDQIDLVAEAFLGRGPALLCEASAAETLAMLVVAMSEPAAGAWHEPRDEAERIRRLSGEVARLAGLLAELTAAEPRAGFVSAPQREWDAGPATPPAPPPVTPDEIRAAVRGRRLRDAMIGEGLFEDPAWDMLLDLYAAGLEGRRVSVSSLCIAAAVAPTTALRWITRLTEAGLFQRHPDAQDRRRAFMALTAQGERTMTAYFAAARRAGMPIA